MTRDQLAQKVEDLEAKVDRLQRALKVQSERLSNQDEIIRAMAELVGKLETALQIHQRIFDGLKTDRRFRNLVTGPVKN
ncbi:MAG: hypothetical protein ACE15E_00555 [Acidobacteriota bacterium]